MISDLNKKSKKKAPQIAGHNEKNNKKFHYNTAERIHSGSLPSPYLLPTQNSRQR
jgi:hypothetical protein